MATVMDVQMLEVQRAARRPYFSAIRWGALIAGVVSGTASYLLLNLLGVAIGLSASDPAQPEAVRISVASGIWMGISMLVSAYIGGYIAGRLSGLSRSTDGMLHGFVSWGLTTLLYAFIAASTVGAIVGGAFSAIGQAVQTGAQVTGQVASNPNAQQQVASVITGAAPNVSAEALRDIQQAIASGDRNQAVSLMTQNLGISPETANQVVDRAAPLLQQSGVNARANAQQAAQQAKEAITGASWWLFFGLLLSLGLGIFGGATGVQASARRLADDRSSERRIQSAVR